MNNEIITNFIPTRYEDRGDSFYFTNEDQSIVVAKHTPLADAYMNHIPVAEPTDEVPNEENATVETSTEVGGENTQVEAEVKPEDENLDDETGPVADEEVTTATEENNESTTEETTDTKVEVSDESTEGNL